jgi:hypothetical protein
MNQDKNQTFREKLFMAFYPLVNKFYFYGTAFLMIALILDYVHVKQYTTNEYSIWGAIVRHWYLTFLIPVDIFLLINAKKKHDQLSKSASEEALR